jgi:gamma-glutamylcyclotransferase (GGCT)/AIG2-like uncharacterized protein YtfP
VLLAFYGTLMRGFDAQKRLGVEAALRYEGLCRIPGELWDLGPYPGLTEGKGEAAGELFSVIEESVIAILDAFEGKEYIRRKVRLVEPEVEAWVYVFRGPLDGCERVASGCWRTHALNRGESRSG